MCLSLGRRRGASAVVVDQKVGSRGTQDNPAFACVLLSNQWPRSRKPIPSLLSTVSHTVNLNIKCPLTFNYIVHRLPRL